MSFLSWAADVLEKVDQSAAGLSDTNKSGQRRRKRSAKGESDVGETSETDASVDYEGRVPHPADKELDAWEKALPESFVTRVARAPSLASEQLRSIQKGLGEGREWMQPNLRRGYEDSLRKLSQVEAQVSVMLAENEKLRREAATAAGMNAQELQHLQAETAASQRSIDDEKNEHTTTRIQAEMRESSLQAENVAYSKALEAIQRHSQDKASEIERLTARLSDLQEGEASLEMELEEAAADLSKMEQEHFEQNKERAASGKEASIAEQEERGLLERQKREAAEIDALIQQLEDRLAQHEKNASKWPSAGQREVELERRLRALNEQLIAKQAQAESFATERRMLELKLQTAVSSRQEQQFGRSNFGGGLKRGKGGRSHASSLDSPSKTRGRNLARFRGGDARSARSSNPIIFAAEAIEGLGSSVGRAVHRNPVLRTLTVGYVMVLHLAVVFMLFHAGGGAAFKR